MRVAQIQALPKRVAGERGFTLLEVMLAMLLATVLLAAVWVAVRLELRFFEAGKSEIEQAQLARAVLERIRTDLQNAVAQPSHHMPWQFAGALLSPPTQTTGLAEAGQTSGSAIASSTSQASAVAEGGISGNSTDSSASGLSTVGGVASGEHAPEMPDADIDLSEAGFAWGERGRFRGLPDSMTFDLRMPPSALSWERPALEEDAAAEPRACTLRTVRYEWIDPSGMVDQGTDDSDGDLSQLPAGLVRWEVRWSDSLAIRQAAIAPQGSPAAEASTEDAMVMGLEEGHALDRLSEIADESTRTTLLSRHMTAMPEIAAVWFRYFDGTQWRSHWDSRIEQRWPVAVDVAIRFVRDKKNFSETALSHSVDDDTTVEPPTDDLPLSGSSSFSDVSAPIGESSGAWDYRLLILLSVTPTSESDTTGQGSEPGRIAERPLP